MGAPPVRLTERARAARARGVSAAVHRGCRVHGIVSRQAVPGVRRHGHVRAGAHRCRRRRVAVAHPRIRPGGIVCEPRARGGRRARAPRRCAERGARAHAPPPPAHHTSRDRGHALEAHLQPRGRAPRDPPRTHRAALRDHRAPVVDAVGAPGDRRRRRLGVDAPRGSAGVHGTPRPGPADARGRIARRRTRVRQAPPHHPARRFRGRRGGLLHPAGARLQGVRPGLHDDLRRPRTGHDHHVVSHLPGGAAGVRRGQGGRHHAPSGRARDGGHHPRRTRGSTMAGES